LISFQLRRKNDKEVYIMSTSIEKRKRFGLVINVHTYIEKLNHFF